MLVDHMVAVKCGKRDFYDVQDEVEKALAKRYPSFRPDGGGTMLNQPSIREIFFRIEHRSVNKVAPYLKKLGYKLVK